MVRKRHKKKRQNISATAPPGQMRNLSPAAQEMVNRIAGGDVDYLKQNFIHVMRDSGSLAKEPEFSDLSLDEERVVRVTERWTKKYSKRLAAAEKKGPDEHHKVFDEMRIKVVADLATPAFRKDVDGRLHALLDRLAATDELDKLETVLYLIPLLAMKDIPWGLCALILQIHRRNHDTRTPEALPQRCSGKSQDLAARAAQMGRGSPGRIELAGGYAVRGKQVRIGGFFGTGKTIGRNPRASQEIQGSPETKEKLQQMNTAVIGGSLAPPSTVICSARRLRRRV